MQKLKFLLYFILFHNIYGYSQVVEQDSLALVSFYNSTNGTNWDNNTGWLTDPVPEWYGITVEGDRVTEIQFYNNNNIHGIIPSQLGNLSELKGLYISNNPLLSGELPTAVFNIITLEGVGIGNCSIIGTIPNSIGNCINLTQLNLPENNLTGPIPPEISNLTNLKILGLWDNQLTGPIPEGLGNLSQLEMIDLDSNQLTGELPEDLGNLAPPDENLWFDVSNNQLSGAIPQSFADNWQSLIDYFDIWNNQFTDLPDFSGHVFNSIRISDNLFTFEDIEINMDISAPPWYVYAPQADIGEAYTVNLTEGEALVLTAVCGGQNNQYQWKKNDNTITGANQATLDLSPISTDDSGVYTCEVTNTEVPDLTIYRRPITIEVTLGIDDEIKEKMICIYPNPTTGLINIKSKMQNVDLMLTDILDKVIYKSQKDFTNLKTQIDLSNHPIGIYFLSVKTNEQSFTYKIIKQL